MFNTVNGQDYAIVTGPDKHTEAVAKFMYKGFEISFSTKGYSMGDNNEVAIFDTNDKVVKTTYTVEEAIQYIDAN